MLGHKSSLEPVLSMVEEAGAVSWTQTEFFQGRTTRWAVAWTFSSAVPLNLGRSSVEKQKIKPPLVFAIESETWKGDYTVATVIAWIIDQLKNLKVSCRWIDYFYVYALKHGGVVIIARASYKKRLLWEILPWKDLLGQALCLTFGVS